MHPEILSPFLDSEESSIQLSYLGSWNSLMIRIIPDFLLHLRLKAPSKFFQNYIVQILHNCRVRGASKRAVLPLLSCEAAQKCAKLAQLSREPAVSPVKARYVNCAKWKCRWNALDAIEPSIWPVHCFSKVFGKYCSSKVFGKYYVSKAYG